MKNAEELVGIIISEYKLGIIKLIDEMIEKHGDEPASIALTELKNKLEE